MCTYRTYQPKWLMCRFILSQGSQVGRTYSSRVSLMRIQSSWKVMSSSFLEVDRSETQRLRQLRRLNSTLQWARVKSFCLLAKSMLQTATVTQESTLIKYYSRSMSNWLWLVHLVNSQCTSHTHSRKPSRNGLYLN